MYFTTRAVQGPAIWLESTEFLNIPFAAINTTVLVLSSVTCQFGVFAAERFQNKRQGSLLQINLWGMREWFALTFLMGAFFIAGQIYEYAALVSEGLTLSSNAYGSVFYLATGFHGLHVTGGLIAFLIVIMLFLAMTFEPKMAIAAIVAVVHDVFITVGIYALVGFDVTPATVIGFLTILGYSLYDTVVVFDKVRENTRSITSTSKQTYTQATNFAVNQTLVRSINTSIIALIPVGSILFVGAGLLGAGTLKDLSLALFIGMIVGAYSSIFIAPPVLAQLREKEPAMIALAKRVSARGAAVVGSASTPGSGQVATATVADRRGPRNQPKRKGRK
jgi:heme/copper-type cytochrome/quinol oxidase subunit 3/gas vesicle protein